MELQKSCNVKRLLKDCPFYKINVVFLDSLVACDRFNCVEGCASVKLFVVFQDR